MTFYELKTNYGTRYVIASKARLRTKMYEYIREENAKGRPVTEIVFYWTPKTVGRL